MGIKKDRTERLTSQLLPGIYDIMVGLNKFSGHLPPNDDSDEKGHVQAVCMASIGKVIQRETGLSNDDTVHFIEHMFEFGKEWKGQDVRYFFDRLDTRRISPIILGHMLSRLADKDYRVDKKKIKNRLCFMSNGYKTILQGDLL